MVHPHISMVLFLDIFFIVVFYLSLSNLQVATTRTTANQTKMNARDYQYNIIYFYIDEEYEY